MYLFYWPKGSAPGVPPQDGLTCSGGCRPHPSRGYQIRRESLRGLHSPAACRVQRPSAAFAARPSDGRGSLRARRNSCSVRCDGPARPSGLVRPRTSRIVTVMSPPRETCSPGATGSESVTVIRHLQMLLLSTRNSAWRPFRAQPGAAPGVAPHQGHPRVTRERSGTSPEQYVGRLLCRRHQAHSALKPLDQHTHRLS